MRVLYLSHGRENSGWSQASAGYLLSLDAAGVDVVSRSIKFNNENPQLPKRILELEQKDSAGCDVVIQHLLPSIMEVSEDFRTNIALFAAETADIPLGWVRRLNMFDQVWVPNQAQEKACYLSGVDRPVRVVPHACDPAKYEKSYAHMPQLKDALGGSFAFYTIGELNRRKNLQAVLRAFHTEFSRHEPVNLVIKTNAPGLNPEQVRQRLDQVSAEVKQGLRIYPNPRLYKREITLTERLSEDELMGLHSACDCFVQASCGEAWSYPAFDAMAMGKTPIVPYHTGYREYVSDQTGWLVVSYPAQAFGVSEAPPDVHTSLEGWWAVSIPELQKTMREAYQTASLRRQKAVVGMERAYDFSYERVGAQMKALLEG